MVWMNWRADVTSQQTKWRRVPCRGINQRAIMQLSRSNRFNWDSVEILKWTRQSSSSSILFKAQNGIPFNQQQQEVEEEDDEEGEIIAVVKIPSTLHNAFRMSLTS